MSLDVKVKDRVQLDVVGNSRNCGLSNVGVVLLPQTRSSEVGSLMSEGG